MSSEDDYFSSSFRNFHSFWMSKHFTDVVIRVRNSTFSSHKLILSAASAYFQGMFTGGMCESLQDEVEIIGIEPDIFTQLLSFIYTGDLSITEDTCQDLLAAADMLALNPVVKKCCQFLSDQLHASNSIGIAHFAEQLGCKLLAKEATNYTNKYFSQVVKEEEFFNMSHTQIISLLQSEHLQIENEFQVFEAGMNWLLHDPPARRRHVFAVLAPVRFPIIPGHQLDQYIHNCEDFSLNIALQKLVQDYRVPCLSSQHLTRLKHQPYLYQPREFARKSLYVIGGYSRHEGGRWSDSNSLCSVDVFSSYQQSWQNAPSLEQPRSGHGVAVLDGRVYVIGGEYDSLIFGTAEVFDPTLEEWQPFASMTVPRCGLGVCSLDGALYALGGWIGSEIGASIERFTLSDGEWREWGRLNTLRFAMGVAAHEGLIYIVGGMSELGTEMDLVESYNPITQEWISLHRMACKRAYVGVAILDNHVYAVGGWNEDSGALASVERYSIEKDAWEFVASMSTPRAGAAVTLVNGSLYVLGGRTSTPDEFTAPTTLDTVEFYDVQNDSWCELGHMPSSRCEAAVAVL